MRVKVGFKHSNKYDTKKVLTKELKSSNMVELQRILQRHKDMGSFTRYFVMLEGGKS